MSVKPCSCKPEKLSPVERQEAKVIKDSCKRLDGQWLMPYPWIKDPSTLPDNREQGERKLVAMERRLVANIENAQGERKLVATERRLVANIDNARKRKLVAMVATHVIKRWSA